MSKYPGFAPFDGDGRVSAYPPPVRPLGVGRPTSVTNSTARKLIDLFERHGYSHHSQEVTTLWVLIAWCQHHKKPFEVWRWDVGTLSSYAIYRNKIHTGVSQDGATRVMKG